MNMRHGIFFNRCATCSDLRQKIAVCHLKKLKWQGIVQTADLFCNDARDQKDLGAWGSFLQTEWSCQIWLDSKKVSSWNNWTTLFPTPTQFVILGFSTSANLFWAEQLLYFDLVETYTLKILVIVSLLHFFFQGQDEISCLSAGLPYAADITVNNFNSKLSPCV